MPRGHKSNVGDIRVARNGYHYTRVEIGWRLTHHLLAEEKLGRNLASNERVLFDDGDRNNLDPTNLRVVIKGTASLAQVTAQIKHLEGQKAVIEEQLIRLHETLANLLRDN